MKCEFCGKVDPIEVMVYTAATIIKYNACTRCSNKVDSLINELGDKFRKEAREQIDLMKVK